MTYSVQTYPWCWLGLGLVDPDGAVQLNFILLALRAGSRLCKTRIGAVRLISVELNRVVLRRGNIGVRELLGLHPFVKIKLLSQAVQLLKDALDFRLTRRPDAQLLLTKFVLLQDITQVKKNVRLQSLDCPPCRVLHHQLRRVKPKFLANRVLRRFGRNCAILDFE